MNERIVCCTLSKAQKQIGKWRVRFTLLSSFLRATVSSYSYHFYKRLCRLTPTVFTSASVILLLPPFLQATVSSYSHRFYKCLCCLTPTVFTSASVVLLPPFLQAPVSSYSRRFYKCLCRLTPIVFTSACVVLLPPFLQAHLSYSHRFYKRLCGLTPTVFTSDCGVLLSLCVKIRVSKRDFTASSAKNSHRNRFKPWHPTLHCTHFHEKMFCSANWEEKKSGQAY